MKPVVKEKTILAFIYFFLYIIILLSFSFSISGVPSNLSDFFTFMGHIYIRHQTIDPGMQLPVLLHCRLVYFMILILICGFYNHV